MPKGIAAFSDGTGNSSAKLFKTNVWRIHQALDLSGPHQIAYYDNGVGTSSFKPYAILGGEVRRPVPRVGPGTPACGPTILLPISPDLPYGEGTPEN